MKIISINNINHQNNSKKSSGFGQKNSYDINKISGLSVINKYNQKVDNDNKENEKKQDNLNNVIYNSIFPLLEYGKYNSGKIFYNYLNNKQNLDNEYDLSLAIGDADKKMGDIESANLFYNKACNGAMKSNGNITLDILKGLKETDIFLGKENGETLKSINDVNDPSADIIYYSLMSDVNIKNDNITQAKNEIKAAYDLMKTNKLTDDTLILKQAMVLTDDRKYSESKKIVTERLDSLTSENKVYTKEFVDYMVLLGVNNFETYNNTESQKVINIFKTASMIAETIGDEKGKETADFSIAKVMFNADLKEFPSYAITLLNRLKKNEHIFTVNLMLGDFYAKINENAKAKEYYYGSIQSIKNDPEREKELLVTYEKLKKVLPQKASVINEEIEKIKDKSLMNANVLLTIFEKALKEKDYEKVADIAKKILDNKNSKQLIKDSAEVYNSFADIELGKDFKTSIDNINKTLKRIAKQACEEGGQSDKNMFLYEAYKREAAILYASMKYQDAADAINNADKYIDKSKNTDDVSLAKKSVILLNYKAQNYYIAKDKTLDYLVLILGDKISKNELMNQNDVQELVRSENDTKKRQIASGYETLGLICLKNKDFKSSKIYFLNAVNIREMLKDRDLQLANAYAALARIAILNKDFFFKENAISSKNMHQKSLDILNRKYPDDQITKEETDFHNKYYGFKVKSAGKYLAMTFRDKSDMIEKFKCYNKELSICE